MSPGIGLRGLHLLLKRLNKHEDQKVVYETKESDFKLRNEGTINHNLNAISIGESMQLIGKGFKTLVYQQPDIEQVSQPKQQQLMTETL